MNLPRKIVTASIAGTFFALILGFVFPNPFGENIDTFKDYFFSSVSAAVIYMLYSFPVIMVYGVIASFISDKIGIVFNKKFGGNKTEVVVSGVMHALFGLVLLWYSLTAAFLYFIIDRMLVKRKNTYRWSEGLKSLFFPIVTWVLLMAIVWGRDFMF